MVGTVNSNGWGAGAGAASTLWTPHAAGEDGRLPPPAARQITHFFLPPKKFFFRDLASAWSFCSRFTSFSLSAALRAAAASRKPKTAFFATYTRPHAVESATLEVASSKTRGSGWAL